MLPQNSSSTITLSSDTKIGLIKRADKTSLNETNNNYYKLKYYVTFISILKVTSDVVNP